MVFAAPCIETIAPYVISVATTFEDSTGIAQATARRAIVMVAPDPEAAPFRAAFSKGRYFNTHIRDRFPCREVEHWQ